MSNNEKKNAYNSYINCFQKRLTNKLLFTRGKVPKISIQPANNMGLI